jgi:hypothetical protein
MTLLRTKTNASALRGGFQPKPVGSGYLHVCIKAAAECFHRQIDRHDSSTLLVLFFYGSEHNANYKILEMIEAAEDL